MLRRLSSILGLTGRSWPLLALLAFPMLATGAMPASALELIMFGKSGCVWCARWERDVGETYLDAQEGRAAPLRRLDIRDQTRLGADLEEPVVYTPTFVLLDDGMEVGRITGYQSEDSFWANLDDMLMRARPRQ